MRALWALAAIALILAATPAHADDKDRRAYVCHMGTVVALKAYAEGTYDAQRPDLEHLHYLVDYWSDRMIVAHDLKIAHGAIDYIAKNMAATGLREPNGGVAWELSRYYLAAACPL